MDWENTQLCCEVAFSDAHDVRCNMASCTLKSVIFVLDFSSVSFSFDLGHPVSVPCIGIMTSISATVASISVGLQFLSNVAAYTCNAPSCTPVGLEYGPKCGADDGQEIIDTVLHVRATGSSEWEGPDCDSGHAENANTIEFEVVDVLRYGAVQFVPGDSLLTANGQLDEAGECWSGSYLNFEFEEGARYLLFANAADSGSKYCGEHVDLTLGTCTTRTPIKNPSAKDLCEAACSCGIGVVPNSKYPCLWGEHGTGSCDNSMLLMEKMRQIGEDSLNSPRALLQDL